MLDVTIYNANEFRVLCIISQGINIGPSVRMELQFLRHGCALHVQ